ncbi:hypothetical protein [Amycolatopsis pithecellobii]|uniref:Nuclear transport factor 2 family protein n=1 Tax=Amycolatopsis pithecellobii TaxID=664692 RepID=A0A6N7Z4V5_9PSEU|nr:hypothetical protein [Amycolatopsis pithecellobii]MTD56509.1 hypothetical protein [Amycolatopsis pithecellobii]
MSKYMQLCKDWHEHLQATIEKTTNPHHQAILRNLQHHAALEQLGHNEELFSGRFIVERPTYHFRGLGFDALTTMQGDEVRRFYEHTISAGVIAFACAYGPPQCTFLVADWGLMAFFRAAFIMDGAHFLAQGFEVDDPAARYIAMTPVANRWWYTPEALLIGEDVYAIDEMVVTKLSPEEDITMEEFRDAISPYLPA